MINIAIPEAIQHQPQIAAGDISFVNYSERGDSLLKNCVIFDHYVVSFVLNGQKQIYRSNQNTVIKAGQGILIPAGNSIIAEHSTNEQLYSSLLVIFPATHAVNFLNKMNAPVNKNSLPLTDYIHFEPGSYLSAYVKGLQTIIGSGQPPSPTIALHKLEELLLVLYELYPQQLTAIFSQHGNRQQLSLKNMVENNLLNNLTLTELAFLANRSLSSFKRDFEKTYGISPQKYIRDKKLEAACYELTKGRHAAEIYLNYGYENLSNFSTAFRKKFGVTPVAYTKATL